MDEVVERTEFTFAELSPQAKETALATARDWATSYDWWDNVYEDAVAVAELLGITISTRIVKLISGKSRQEPSINFSGFCYGACYEGHYRHPDSDVVKAVNDRAPQDQELNRIAKGLTVLQVSARMTCGGLISAGTKTRGQYSYSGTMDFDVSHDNDAASGYDNDFRNLESDLTQLLRDFADWIYKQLETENDYLCSEENLTDNFEANEALFDEDGAII